MLDEKKITNDSLRKEATKKDESSDDDAMKHSAKDDDDDSDDEDDDDDEEEIDIRLKLPITNQIGFQHGSKCVTAIGMDGSGR